MHLTNILSIYIFAGLIIEKQTYFTLHYLYSILRSLVTSWIKEYPKFTCPLNSEPLSRILWYPELLLSLREIPLWRPRGHPVAHANCSMPLVLPSASVNSRVLPVFIRGPNLSPLHDWQLPGKLDGYRSLSDSCTAISNCLMSSELRYRLIRKLKYKDGFILDWRYELSLGCFMKSLMLIW